MKNNNFGKGKDNMSKGGQTGFDKNKQQPNQGGQGGYGRPQGTQQTPQQQKQPWGGQTDRHGGKGEGDKHK